MKTGGEPLLLSFDVEEFSDLSHLGIAAPTRDPSLPRQMEATLDLLDEIGARATFFCLGGTARRFPDLIAAAAGRGHEIASHGYEHEPVDRLSPAEFRRDLEASIDLIGELTGSRPRGYRAPLFSIAADAVWALEVLAELGFSYDSSQLQAVAAGDPAAGLHRITLPSGREIWEMPPPVWHLGPLSVPIGGGSYWRVLPTRLLSWRIDAALSASGPTPLYFHPYELDPEPLRVVLPTPCGRRERLLALRTNMLYNPGRTAVPRRIRKIASLHPMIGYEEALANGARGT